MADESWLSDLFGYREIRKSGSVSVQTRKILEFGGDATVTDANGVTRVTVGSGSGLTITPDALTSDVDDYSPDDWSAADVVRLSSDAARTITGFDSVVSDVQKTLINVGNNPITIAVESTSSSAANRVSVETAVTLESRDACVILYDTVTERWRVISVGVVPILRSPAVQDLKSLGSSDGIFVGQEAKVTATGNTWKCTAIDGGGATSTWAPGNGVAQAADYGSGRTHTEIQAAMEDWDIVEISGEQWVIGQPLDPPRDNMVIRGVGWETDLHVTTNIAGAIFPVDRKGIIIENLKVSGDLDPLNNIQSGIHLQGCDNCIVRGCYVFETSYDGILLLHGCHGCIVSGNVVEGCGDDGINIGGVETPNATDNTVIGNIVFDIANDGIHVSHGSKRTTVTGNVVYNCTNGIGFFICDTGAITGNIVYNCSGKGIAQVFGSGHFFAITGNQVQDCGVGIYNLQASGNTVTGNVVRNSGTYGIQLTHGVDFDLDSVISGNVVEGGCSAAGISSGTGCRIDGNSVTDTDNNGITLGGTVRDVAITNNNIRVANTGIDHRAGSNVQIHGNHIQVSGSNLKSGIICTTATGGTYSGLSILGNTVSGYDGGTVLQAIYCNNYDGVLIDGNVLSDVGTHAIRVIAGQVMIGDNIMDGGLVTNAVPEFADGDATPSVRNGKIFTTANTGATTITALDDGHASKTVTVVFGDSDTTIDFTGTTLKGNGGANWSPASGDHMVCTHNGTNWYCQISDNTA